MLGDTIHREKWKGHDLYVTDGCRTRGFRKGRYLLIPPYDEYLISYKSRDIVLSLDYRHKAHNNSGIFQMRHRPRRSDLRQLGSVIARDGVICGNWAPFRAALQADFFLGEHSDGVEAEWLRYHHFLTK